MDPDVKFQKPNCCCAAPDGRKHVELKKTFINEVSLSGACSTLERLPMVRKVPGSKSAQGQKYHVTRVVHLDKAIYSHLLYRPDATKVYSAEKKQKV